MATKFSNTANKSNRNSKSASTTPIKSTTTTVTKTVAKTTRTASTVSAEQRDAMIAEAAYYQAEARGFAPGGEEDDWLAAEYQVDVQLGIQE